MAAAAGAAALVAFLLGVSSEASAATRLQPLRGERTAVPAALSRGAGELAAWGRQCLGKSSSILDEPGGEGVQCLSALCILRGGAGGRQSRRTFERNPEAWRGGGAGGRISSNDYGADRDTNGYRRRGVGTRGPPDLNMRPPPTAPGYSGTGREERVKTVGPPDRAAPKGMFSFSPPYFSPRRGRQEPAPAENFRSRRGGSDPYGTTSTSSPTAAGSGWGESGRGRGLMAVHFLVLSSLALFSLDVIMGIDRVLQLSLDHARPRSWQPVTSLLLHGDQYHLMSNMFILMIFGKMAEEDMGSIGMLLSFVICGVVSNLVSLSLMPRDVYSCGASGAVFGLFSVCVLGKIFNLERGAVPEVRLRELVETVVFGWFVAESVMSEMRMVANGGVRGTDHAAHFGGVFAGAVLILLARRSITREINNSTR